MNRDPGEPVKKILRQEVHFGCPVEDCGSPYLSFHHFDPPWRIQKHHDPDGMIALCLEHHIRADRYAYSISQLRAMKSNPFLKRVGGRPVGDISWKRETLVVRCGSNIGLNCPILIRHGSNDVVYLSKDEDGNDLLNINLLGADGKPILEMRDNNWKLLKPVFDIDCQTSGGEIRIKEKQKDIYFNITFKSMKKGGLKGLVLKDLWNASEDIKQGMGFVERSNPPESVTDLVNRVESEVPADEYILCDITGRLVSPYLVQLAPDKIISKNGSIIAFCCLINSKVGIQF